MAKIHINSINRTIQVPDGLTNEQYDAMVQEAIAAHNSQQDTSGVGSTVGGTGGAIAGAIKGAGVGSTFGPIGTIVGGVIGGGVGGFAGGAAGETAEQLLTGKGDTSDISQAAVAEGLFGFIPGGGALLTKTGLRLGGQTLSRITNLVTGKGIKLPSEAVLQGAAKLNKKQKGELFFQSLQEVFPIERWTPNMVKNMNKNWGTKLKLKKGKLEDENGVLFDIEGLGFDSWIKILRNEPGFEKVVNNYYAKLAQQGVVRGGVATGVGRAGIEASLPQTNISDRALGALNKGGYFNKGLDAKISKIYKEGYTAPGQAYAIAKSMGYNKGGYFNNGGTSFGRYFDDYRERRDARRENPPISLEFLAEMLTPYGTYVDVKAVHDELQKDNPDWYKIGILGGAGILGAIPTPPTKAARAALRKGVKSHATPPRQSLEDDLFGGTITNKYGQTARTRRSGRISQKTGLPTVPVDRPRDIRPTGVDTQTGSEKFDALGYPKTPTGTPRPHSVAKPRERLSGVTAGRLGEAEPYIQNMARKVPENHRDDFIQEARTAVIEAAQKFDPERGVKFTTYIYPSLQGARRKIYELTRPVGKGKDTVGTPDIDNLASFDNPFRAIDQLDPADQEFAYDIIDQAASREGPKVVRVGNKTERVPVVKDKELREKYGLTQKEFDERKQRIGRIVKEAGGGDFQQMFAKPKRAPVSEAESLEPGSYFGAFTK